MARPDRPTAGGERDADAESREIIGACLASAPGAWERFLDRYGRLVSHLVRENLRSYGIPFSEQDGDDIAEEVLLSLIEDRCRVLRSFRAPFRFVPWLAVITRRRCNRHARRKHVPMKTLSEGPPGAEEDAPDPPAEASAAPAPQAERSEAARIVLEEIELLPEPGRTLVRLFYFQGRKYREISRATKIPIKTVSSSLWRAKSRLEERLRARGIGGEARRTGRESAGGGP